DGRKTLMVKKKKTAKATANKTKKTGKGAGYRSFRLGKRVKRDSSDISSVWRLLAETYRFFIRNWRPLGGITLIYGILYFLLVRAVPQVDLSEYSQLIDELSGSGSETFKTLTLAGVALASVGQAGSELN